MMILPPPLIVFLFQRCETRVRDVAWNRVVKVEAEHRLLPSIYLVRQSGKLFTGGQVVCRYVRSTEIDFSCCQRLDGAGDNHACASTDTDEFCRPQRIQYNVM